MDFTFNEQERQFAESVRRYSLQRLLPDFQKWDCGNPFPRERVRELGALGITGLSVAAADGGGGGTFAMAGTAAEDLGRGDISTTLFLQVGMIGGSIAHHAT